MREKGFDRGAWMTLALALFILLLGISVPVIQFNLPTEGWLSTMVGNFADNTIYKEDLLGVNRDLQVNDLLVAVEGIPVTELNPDTFPNDHLAAEDVIAFTVQRGNDLLNVNVTMSHWTWKAIATFNLGKADSWLNGLTSLILLVVGFYVFLNRPTNPAAQALLVLNAIMALLFFFTGLVPNSITNVVIPAMTTFYDISLALIFSLLLPPSLIRFGLVFPRLKRSIEHHPALQFLPYAVGLLVYFVFRNGEWMIGYIWMVIALLLTVGLLVHSALTVSDSVSRAQIRWGVLGAVVGLGLFLLSYLSIFGVVSGTAGAIVESFSNLGIAVFGVALGIAILRYRLFDINVIIRKTLVYAALTATLGLVFFGGVASLQQVVGSLTGTEDSPVIIVISTLLIAALFSPLRRLIQDFIDRRFYRQKYNAEQVLAEFADSARNETDLDVLSGKLVQVVSQTMQPEHTALWLKPQGREK